jgi:hypothetical protein
MNETKDGIEVRVGQLWKDCDKRSGARACHVQAVLNGKAHMRDAGGYLTWVSVRRMHRHSTGWVMVRDENGKLTDQE